MAEDWVHVDKGRVLPLYSDCAVLKGLGGSWRVVEVSMRRSRPIDRLMLEVSDCDRARSPFGHGEDARRAV